MTEDISIEALEKAHKQLLNLKLNNENKLLKDIQQSIKNFVKAYEKFQQNNKYSANIGTTLNKLNNLKEKVYIHFFTMQNLINYYLGSEIVITYIYVNSFGEREIHVMKNTINNIEITEGKSKNGIYHKLSYIDQHYRNLKNSLSDSQNKGLQEAAFEVENRYNKYKKNVLWNINKKWYGYYFKTGNKGPINEAFANFYIHEIELKNNLEQNINTFMTDKNYGAINADYASGFLIGDVSRNNIQYAVKGIFASPQGFKGVYNYIKKEELDKNVGNWFDNFQKMLFTFSEEGQSKRLAASQLKKLTEKEINELVKNFNLNK